MNRHFAMAIAIVTLSVLAITSPVRAEQSVEYPSDPQCSRYTAPEARPTDELECGLPEGYVVPTSRPMVERTPEPTGEIGTAITATPGPTLPPTDTVP